jgi:hypothetical protein
VAGYDVVLLVSPSLALLQRWDEACRQQSIAFFGAASRGACSFFFVDLQTHTYSSTVCVCQQLFQAAFSAHFHTLHMAHGITQVAALQTAINRPCHCCSQEKQDGKPKAGQLTAHFCSLAEALQAPWDSLRPKRTHELYYGLRGRQAAGWLQFKSILHGAELLFPASVGASHAAH